MAPTTLSDSLIYADRKPATNCGSLGITAAVVPEKRTSKNSLNHSEDAAVTFKQREFPADLPGPEYKMELVWRNIVIFVFLHLGALYGVTRPVNSWWTILFLYTYGFAGAFGITAGAHRYFAHRSYKANKALKALLIYFQSIAFQNSVFEWARDHRVHHKFCDTNADPHNSRRGFFFSHMGWLLCKKHTDVRKFGAKVDMSDLANDEYIMFQHRNYLPIALLTSAVIPTLVSLFVLEESFPVAFFTTCVWRYVLSLHLTWLINSAAHMFGMKPYDKSISPVDTRLVALLAFGEGFHNFHHVFPWDYKTSELGSYYFNFSTGFLDFFAWLGWATELKTVSDEMIKKRIARTGDGTHKYSNLKTKEEKLMAYIKDRTTDENGNHVHHEEDNVWGWGDVAMHEDDKKYVTILSKAGST